MSAVISECGRYRYRLRRAWDMLLADIQHKESLVFVMLNPSTADSEKDDPTIRRCIGFGKLNGYVSLEVVNLFALRATDPKDLITCFKDGMNIIGPENDEHIINACRGRNVVLAWGAQSRHWRGRAIAVQRALRHPRIEQEASTGLFVLKHLIDGTPAHPLMLSYNCRLTRI